MRRALLLLFLLILAAPLAVVAALVLALEDRPLVARPAALGAAQIERVKRILDDNDPRPLKAGVQRTVSLPQEDVDLLANYFASRHARGGARVALQPGVATIATSAELPANPVGRFMNVRASLRDAGALPPRLEDVTIGRLPVPAFLANAALDHAWAKLLGNDDARAIAAAVRRIAFAAGRIDATFVWRAGLPDRVRTALLPRAEQEDRRLAPGQRLLVRGHRRRPRRHALRRGGHGERRFRAEAPDAGARRIERPGHHGAGARSPGGDVRGRVQAAVRRRRRAGLSTDDGGDRCADRRATGTPLTGRRCAPRRAARSPPSCSARRRTRPARRPRARRWWSRRHRAPIARPSGSSTRDHSSIAIPFRVYVIPAHTGSA